MIQKLIAITVAASLVYGSVPLAAWAAKDGVVLNKTTLHGGGVHIASILSHEPGGLAESLDSEAVESIAGEELDHISGFIEQHEGLVAHELDSQGNLRLTPLGKTENNSGPQALVVSFGKSSFASISDARLALAQNLSKARSSEQMISAIREFYGEGLRRGASGLSEPISAVETAPASKGPSIPGLRASGELKRSEDRAVASEPRILGIDSPSVSAGIWQSVIGHVSRVWGDIKSLPKGFRLMYVPAWTFYVIGQEMLTVALPVYTASLYGTSAALLVTGIAYGMRIPGVWLGSFVAGKIDPKWLASGAQFGYAASVIAIPLSALASSAWMPSLYSLLMVNAVAYGLYYGVTRGITENLLPRFVIGSKDKHKLELGSNFAYQIVEISAFLTAFAAVGLLSFFGGNLMYVASAFMGVSAIGYAMLRYVEPWQPSKLGASSAPSRGVIERIKDYAPFMFFRFAHFSIYSVFATVLSQVIFKSNQMQGNIIGAYDAGSWLFSLLFTLALFPKLSERHSTFIGAAGFAAFLWSSYLFHSPLLTSVLAGFSGGMVTIISNKWMAHYNNTLNKDEVKNISKWAMTVATLGLLPMFLVVKFSSDPSTISQMFLSVSVLVTAVAVWISYLVHKGVGTANGAPHEK